MVKIMWFDEYSGFCAITGAQYGIIINPDDIFQVVDTYNWRIAIFPNISGDKADLFKLPETVEIDGEEFEINDLTTSELEDIINNFVGEEGKIIYDEYLPITEADDYLCFDYYNKEFFSISDLEILRAFEYWNGNNIKTIVFDPDTMIEYKIEIIDSYNLDTWDGRNYSYGSMGRHAILHKIKCDDLEEDNILLWEDWSQWQGEELPTGKLITESDAMKLLKNHEELEEIVQWINVK